MTFAVCSARSRNESGTTLLETIIAIMLASVLVIALATGLLTTAQATGASNRSTRLSNTLNAFGEALKQLTYKDCADGDWYLAAYLATADDPGFPLPTKDMKAIRVVSVEYWRPGVFPATGPTIPGQFETSCTIGTSGNSDAGSQLVRFSIDDGFDVREGEVVKRNPASSTFDPTPPTTLPGGSSNISPVAAFTVAPSTGAGPLNVGVDASASLDPDGSPLSYLWTFDDGGSANTVTATHTFMSSGRFSIVLRVTDDKGATAVATRTVVVTGAPATPADFRKVRSGTGYVDFAWTSLAGVDRYEIDVRKVFGLGCGDVSMSVTAPAANAHASLGTACTPGLFWRYRARIRAVVGTATSAWSAEIDVP